MKKRLLPTLLPSLFLGLFATPLLAGDALVTSWNNNMIVRYRENTGAFHSVFVASGAGGLARPHSARYGPDGQLYVTSFANSMVLRYDGQSGAFIDAFVPAGLGNLANPTDALFGPDGHLYVTSFNTPGVKKYDGTTGAFLGNFITPGNGLVAAESACFGPDGNWYQANSSGNNILRYDGQTGAFIDIFASAGNLDDTHALVFGPSGNLYASGFGNQRVNEYDGTTGAFLGVFVGTGNNLVSAHGMAFHKGTFYVCSFGSDKINRHDPVTGDFLGRYFAPGLGGVDGPISITFMPDPARAQAYGCGTNPVGSLTVLKGVPSIGTQLEFGVDNPLGTQSPGSLALLLLSFAPDPAFPCGTLLPGLSMADDGAPGELLVSLGFERFLTLMNGPWTGTGNPVSFPLNVPADLRLVGVEIFVQGVLVDPTPGAPIPVGLTDAQEVRIGF